MKLFILGLLMERDRHPYEIRQTIKERNWNVTFKLRDGSLYYAVDQMREDGLIEAAEVIPVPGESRPDKTVYRITEQGKATLTNLVLEQLDQQSRPQHPLFPALLFVRHAPPSHVIGLLERQSAACAARIEHIRAVLEMKQDLLPRGSRHMLEGIVAFSETELRWLESVMADARSGELYTGGRGGKPENKSTEG